ncbi:MAG: 4Fe-4S cluster-binding domain-containing protein [Deltaproteobacteria bacterium]|jgi:7-carboxy-7-deazaguanine synthase|uniref:7-carboxy-7-deazaguanine synthase n=1 Tax=Candidatus Acidulodesulfobacterium acidiphilum TaxID=2597224 RepID=A0A520XH26_9DELT|nr:4Fe-4S cluster-binding domain-containing protein [Deltaproteobacteria bacterium]RZV40501.1 MAG: 4Fe-4S cluster-binding domain-containing protein [Candidatus Acidulodesulfobacterium acidiphilum]
MLYVNDIFYSIQGESSYSGYPCKFIRLAGCNLKCGYCDTQEALDTKNSKQFGINDIIKSACGSGPAGIKLIEITGGEPMMQNESLELMNKLIELKYTVLLETNGTISLKKVHHSVIKIIDVKCPSSGHSKEFFFENLKYIGRNDEIKFVIGSKDDYDYAKNFITEYSLYSLKLIFSPVEGAVSHGEIAGKILNDGLNVRLGVQLHKIIGLK